MVKFFRNIRSRLLAEGKITNYIKYGIGEIVLVVIGILIALQINNWNENKKSNLQYFQYLTAIKSNIQEDLMVLDSLIEQREQIIANSKKERNMFLKNSFDFETTVNATRTAFGAFYFYPNISAFHALSNSSVAGKLNGTELNTLLIDYYAQISIIQQEEKSVNEQLKSSSDFSGSQEDKTLILSYYLLQKKEFDSLNVSFESISKQFEFLHNSIPYRSVINETTLQEYILVPAYEKLNVIGPKVISAINLATND
ncbi:MAG: hypothetical protein ACI9OE_002203 [Mariniflexile sp.]|jgi:hypothetical protein